MNKMNIQRNKSRNIIVWFVFIIIIWGTFIAVNIYINNYQENNFYSGTAFLRTIDCAKYFDNNPNSKYIISFEICSDKEGDILVYQQNGSTSKYYFTEYVYSTIEYKKHEIVVVPTLKDANVAESFLAFYGGKDNEIIPRVRNINISTYDTR